MRNLFIFIVLLLATTAFAKPYYSEYEEIHGFRTYIVMFLGNIEPEDEPQILVLEQKYLEAFNGYYMEYRNLRSALEAQLNQLGVNVDVVEDYDDRRSFKVPQPSEFHHIQRPYPSQNKQEGS